MRGETKLFATNRFLLLEIYGSARILVRRIIETGVARLLCLLNIAMFAQIAIRHIINFMNVHSSSPPFCTKAELCTFCTLPFLHGHTAVYGDTPLPHTGHIHPCIAGTLYDFAVAVPVTASLTMSIRLSCACSIHSRWKPSIIMILLSAVLALLSCPPVSFRFQ